MRAILSTPLTVHRFAVFAEMAWLERRPELGLLCRAARDQGRRISAATVQSALPGLSDAGANNVLAWCKKLGLCDTHGGLTTLGETVAGSDEAPVPEQGVYGLWLTQHPVLGRRVLVVERLSSSRDQRFEELTALPLEPDRDKVFRSVVPPRDRFLVRNLPAPNGQATCLLGTTSASCRLRWTLDFDGERDSWQLEGLIEHPQGNGKYALVPLQHDSESDGLDLWALASRWGDGPLSASGRWQAAERRLQVSFRGLAEGEIESFRKTLLLGRVEVPGKGSYGDVTLEDVAIGPATAGDAQSWAMARFERHLAQHPAYRSRVEIRALFSELAEGTPLERFSPTLPAHAELVRSTEKDPLRFWSLVAPVDLAPHPVSEEDLAPLRIGQASAPARVEPDGGVRVPYRGGWSMSRLVQGLLQGVTPRKVLLCDRYVRGKENLAALGLLVQSLRQVAPASAFEVCTGEDADRHQVQSVTGTPPRSYGEVFGKNLPHDRYLLVLPGQGPGFAWQMSNSPLHARPDQPGAGPDSPLRWKDLLAQRVSPEELPSGLRQWFAGGAR